MKLKKILSGFLAAAMAVTSMVTASITAGAEGESTIWTGSFDCGTSWSVTEDVPGFAAAKAGDVLKITCSAIGNAGYHQVMLKDSSWADFEAGALAANAGAASCMQLSEADAAAVKNGFKIAGYDCTVTKIEHLPVVGASQTIWSGSFDCGTSWSVTEDVSGFEAAKAGDVLKITCSAIGNAGYHQVMLKDSSWADFEAGALAASAGAASCMQLSEADAAAVKSGFKIAGYDCTVTKIELLQVGKANSAHKVEVADATNGTVTPDKTEAEKDEKVTLTVTPVAGYELDKITVAGDSSVVAVTADNTFTMPDEDVTVTATFKKKVVELTGITLDKATAAVLVGKTVTLTAAKEPENTTDETEITWTSSAEAVATVADGVVTGVAAGTATITATCGTKTATCDVTVTAEAVPCTAIALDKTEAALKKGESVTLTATATPANTTDEITWESDNTAVATVADGKVTAVSRGTATITVKCGEQTATCKVSVTEDKTVTAPVAAGGQKSYEVVSTVNGKEVKTVDTIYAITEADLECKGYEVTITNPTNGKTITREITNAYKSVTVKSAEDLGNDTFTGYYLVVRVTNVPKDVNLSYAFKPIA